MHAIADMLAQGTTIQKILDGYLALIREQKIEPAPLYVKAFPRRRHRPARQWATKESHRVGHRLAS